MVAEAWRRLFGVPWDVRLWVAFFVHDLGYLKKERIEGPDAELHVCLGARVLAWLFGDDWGAFSLRHSRYWAKKHNCEVSRLAAADKLAFVLTPWWIYLPMARATGELAEYMAASLERQAGDDSFRHWERVMLSSGDARLWLRALHNYTRRWVDEHKDRCVCVEDIRREQVCADSASRSADVNQACSSTANPSAD